jgi:hypothetical protein
MMGCLCGWRTAFLSRALDDEDQGAKEIHEVDRRRVLTDPPKRTTERQRENVRWAGLAEVESVPAAKMEALWEIAFDEGEVRGPGKGEWSVGVSDANVTDCTRCQYLVEEFGAGPCRSVEVG